MTEGPATVVLGNRDTIEDKLTQIMGEVLGFQAIEPDEDFFDLGGDSIQVVELLSLIERRMGLKIPFHVLAHGATVDRLARIAREELGPAEWSPLVSLKSDGSAVPLFLCAPSGGNVFCYQRLITELNSQQPIYGLQAPGIDDARLLLHSVEEMAECYLREVVRVQPHGPYCLGGWSYGALVAYEMAVRLTERGEAVAFLLVIDSAICYSFRMVDAVINEKGLGICGVLSKPFDEQVAYFREKTRGTHIFPPNAELDLCRGIYRVCMTNIRAGVEYRPRPFPGTVTLLEAEEKLARTRVTAEEEWRPLCQQVNRHYVPGNHFTVISPPHVQRTAAVLRRCLEEVGIPIGITGNLFPAGGVTDRNPACDDPTCDHYPVTTGPGE